MQKMQTRCFWGGLLFLVIGVILAFNGAIYPFGFSFLGAGIALGLLWYWLWSRDLRAIRRNQESRQAQQVNRQRQEAPMAQKQRKVPMSSEQSRRITPPGEL